LYPAVGTSLWGGIADDPPADVRALADSTAAKDACADLVKHIRAIDWDLSRVQYDVHQHAEAIASEASYSLRVCTRHDVKNHN
jgi:hypothetical protein